MRTHTARSNNTVTDFEKGREMCLILDIRHRGDSQVKLSDSAVFGTLPSSIMLLKKLSGEQIAVSPNS